jgi:uncharacterized RDD family membrane protein YckC
MADEMERELLNPAAGLQYQGIGIRAASILIDFVISWIVGMLIISIELNFSQNSIIPLLGGLSWIVFFLVYYVYMEGSRGQTIGKMLTRIKVVNEDGGKINMKQALIRNVLRFFDAIAFYLVGAILIWRSDKKQRLGDSVAKTIVVKA